MKKIRIAVFVSGGGTNLQALLDAQHAGKLPSGEIVLVLSNRRDAYALKRAAAAGVPTVVVERGSDFEERILQQMEKHSIELIVLAGFMAILKETLTSKFRDRMINIHPSLIPSFCGKGFYGLHVHEAALQYGVKITGATVHYVNEIPDGGRIILQEAVRVEEKDTPETLQKRVMREAEWKILPQATEMVCQALNARKG
ncbi:MAG: phosphoribosylglycinamide formyltransferase [Peptoniphilaceae bacterium]|nr:phosphoribosylglycinamide formyltransferase [Peptoniphilaceae bacterium]MCI6660633.1 phosphoribosylglycinamide formyltransferase [Peptoniphilaceae bacterium]MDY4196615.1 phosphoribosylglycinamide formyltransferase [Peptoniphilaceae bacterium]MDY5842268.1 phosphoribosylglycinamide formyltransferase [Peptoniphilaceae bacterium]